MPNETMPPDAVREVFPEYQPIDLSSVESALARARQTKLDIEQARREKEESEKRRAEAAKEQVESDIETLEGHRLQLETALKELQDVLAPEDDLNLLKEQLQFVADEIAERVALIGHDPIKMRARERTSELLYARLLPKIERASTSGELRTVLNEIEQALPSLLPEASNLLLKHVELHELATHQREVVDAIREEQRHLENPVLQERRESIEQIVTSIAELESETSSGVEYVGYLSKEELLAQLCIWAGKVRLLQENEDILPGAANRRLRRIFARLSDLSKEQQPGYCHALDKGDSRDWASYIQNAENQLITAQTRAQAVRQERARQQAAEGKRRAEAEDRLRAGRDVLKQLPSMLERIYDDEYRDPELSAIIRHVLDLLPASEVAPVMVPYPGLVATGAEFKALRRQMTKLGVVFSSPDPIESLTAEVSEFVEAARASWKGKSLALVGGQKRPELLDQLDDLIEPETVRWVESERGASPRALGSLIESVRAGGTDVVVIFTSFVGHTHEELERVCGQGEVPVRWANGSIGIRVLLEALASSPGEA